MKYSIPGIKAIYVVNAKKVPVYNQFLSVAAGIVPMLQDAYPVPIVGVPSCEVKSNEESGSETATLKFRSCDTIPRNIRPAFLISAADGKHYLLGSSSRPYPFVSCTHSTGQPDGDPSAYDYEITLEGLRPLTECV